MNFLLILKETKMLNKIKIENKPKYDVKGLS